MLQPRAYFAFKETVKPCVIKCIDQDIEPPPLNHKTQYPVLNGASRIDGEYSNLSGAANHIQRISFLNVIFSNSWGMFNVRA